MRFPENTELATLDVGLYQPKLQPFGPESWTIVCLSFLSCQVIGMKKRIANKRPHLR